MINGCKLSIIWAAIFDMDGVITDTAEHHFMSWKLVFDDYLKSNPMQVEFCPFTKRDYLEFVDGVMRDDGIRNFFSSRKLLPSIEYQADLIKLLGNKKDELFLNKVRKDGVKCFSSSIKLVKFLNKLGKKVAVISSSKYCKEILTIAKVIDLFDVVVDGVVLAEKNIPGKPNPGIFLEAARLLKTPPENCLLVEDAISGVKAGKEGHFGLVIGIDRNSLGEAYFKENGADIVVNDLSNLSLDKIIQWCNTEVD